MLNCLFSLISIKKINKFIILHVKLIALKKKKKKKTKILKFCTQNNNNNNNFYKMKILLVPYYID